MSHPVREASESKLCPCGSGLTRARCCELNLASLFAREASRHLAPLEDRAEEAQRGCGMCQEFGHSTACAYPAPSRLYHSAM
jgi:hypothetical protein